MERRSKAVTGCVNFPVDSEEWRSSGEGGMVVKLYVVEDGEDSTSACCGGYCVDMLSETFVGYDSQPPPRKRRRLRMHLEYLEELSPEQDKCFHDQDVNLDDWDFMFLTFEVDQFSQETTEERDTWENKTFLKTEWRANSWQLNWILERMGCAGYKWYRIEYQGKPAMLGVTYHS